MKKHIVCFGDSNTHGYDALTGGRFDENERWPCLLQRLLGDEYLVLEEGLSGRTTVFRDPCFESLSGLDMIYSCMMSHEPVDLLLIMLGTNDTKERFSASAECIGLGMRRLVRKARSITESWRDGRPDILIITPQQIGPAYINTEVGGPMGPGCAEKSKKLSEVFAAVAKEENCRYLDANQVIHSPANDTDYMHLTKEGHRELAQALASYILQE